VDLLVEMMGQSSMSSLELAIFSNRLTENQLKELRDFGGRISCLRFPKR
jgi:hypothetical protein